MEKTCPYPITLPSQNQGGERRSKLQQGFSAPLPSEIRTPAPVTEQDSQLLRPFPDH
jgi:hypothetical protein